MAEVTIKLDSPIITTDKSISEITTDGLANTGEIALATDGIVGNVNGALRKYPNPIITDKFNGALIQNLTTASTEADIRKAFTSVNAKTVLFPTPGSIISKLDGGNRGIIISKLDGGNRGIIISKLDGGNRGIVVSLSEPDVTTLGRTITVYHGNDTYTIIVKSDFTKVLMPWSKVSPKRNVYTNYLKQLNPEYDEARIRDYLTPQVYRKYDIVYPVKPQTGDLVEEYHRDELRYVAIKVVRNKENPNEYTDILIPESGTANAYTRIVLKNDLTAIKSRNLYYIFKTCKRAYNGDLLLALDTVKAETIENSITKAYSFTIEGRDPGLAAQLPEVGDLIKTYGEVAPVCEVLLDTDSVQHTRWFSKGKLYEVLVNTALTHVPEDPKVIYDTTSGSRRDLYISAGAVYNEQTGYYELNGLTDITEEEMRVIYNRYLIDIGTNTTASGWLTLNNGERTNLPCITRADIFAQLDNGISGSNVEVLRICADSIDDYIRVCYVGRTMAEAHQSMPKLRKVIGVWQYNSDSPRDFNFDYGQPFQNCPLLEEIRINRINKSHTFAVSPNLSKESVQYMITNANPPSGAAVGSITITLHPTAYARLKDDADIVAALEAKGGIVTLVSA